MINQHLSPCHIGIGDTLCSIYLFIVNLFYKDIDIFSVIKIVISIMILLGCLVFTEIIICKCWGMDQYIVKAIQQRALDDKEIVCQLNENPLYGKE